MDPSQILGEFENTIEDALAVCLRRIMEQGGRPFRKDYRDKELYLVHVRQWADALKVLEAYDNQKR